jgi:hypothetical protein
MDENYILLYQEYMRSFLQKMAASHEPNGTGLGYGIRCGQISNNPVCVETGQMKDNLQGTLYFQKFKNDVSFRRNYHAC